MTDRERVFTKPERRERSPRFFQTFHSLAEIEEREAWTEATEEPDFTGRDRLDLPEAARSFQR